MLERAIQLWALQTCPGGPGDKVFPHKIYEQVDQPAQAERTPGGAVNMQPIQGTYSVALNSVILLDNATILNPTTQLPDAEGYSAIQHGCLEQLLTALGWELYTDGSSFMKNGQQQTGFGLLHGFQSDH